MRHCKEAPKGATQMDNWLRQAKALKLPNLTRFTTQWTKAPGTAVGPLAKVLRTWKEALQQRVRLSRLGHVFGSFCGTPMVKGTLDSTSLVPGVLLARLASVT